MWQKCLQFCDPAFAQDTTVDLRFAVSIWNMNSRHLPHGGTTLPSLETATILAIRLSPAVIMAAMALCSAQNPMPLPISMETPKYRFRPS